MVLVCERGKWGECVHVRERERSCEYVCRCTLCPRSHGLSLLCSEWQCIVTIYFVFARFAYCFIVNILNPCFKELNGRWCWKIILRTSSFKRYQVIYVEMVTTCLWVCAVVVKMCRCFHMLLSSVAMRCDSSFLWVASLVVFYLNFNFEAYDHWTFFHFDEISS